MAIFRGTEGGKKKGHGTSATPAFLVATNLQVCSYRHMGNKIATSPVLRLADIKNRNLGAFIRNLMFTHDLAGILFGCTKNVSNALY